jgi:sulfur carrier protein
MTMQREPVQIIVNGEGVRLEGPLTVADLIDRRQPRPPFAVEVNKRLVRRGTFENTPLADGDRVEIVTLVGGG